MVKKSYFWSGILVLVSAMVFWGVKLHFKSTSLEQFHGTLLDRPRDMQPFSLTGIDGKPFDLESLKGHWSILFFGFTHCGYMCPTAMGELSKMYRRLEKEHVTPKPLVVMITVDPKRDSEKKLSQYVKAFHSNFFGARTDEVNALKTLTQTLGIAYTTVKRASSSTQVEDDIEHTGAFLFFNPKGQLVAFSTPPHHSEALVEDYRLLIQ